MPEEKDPKKKYIGMLDEDGIPTEQFMSYFILKSLLVTSHINVDKLMDLIYQDVKGTPSHSDDDLSLLKQRLRSNRYLFWLRSLKMIDYKGDYEYDDISITYYGEKAYLVFGTDVDVFVFSKRFDNEFDRLSADERTTVLNKIVAFQKDTNMTSLLIEFDKAHADFEKARNFLLMFFQD